MNRHPSISFARTWPMRVAPVVACGLIVTAALAEALGDSSERASYRADRCGPKFLLMEPGDESLLVVCEKNDSILRLDVNSGEVVTRGSTEAEPFALSMHPDGRRLYVSCRYGQAVDELDAQSLQRLRRFALRGDPTGHAVSVDGKRLYVALNSLDQVAVVDLGSAVVTKHLAAGNAPHSVRLSPAHGQVVVTNVLSNPIGRNQLCRNEFTVIDDQAARVVDRVILEGANIGREIDFSSDGSFAVAAISRPKNLVPMVQVARGWVVTNGFALLWFGADRAPTQLLVDLPNRSYADPFGVALTPDDRKFYLTAAGVDTVLAVDMAKVRATLDEIAAGEIARPADHLGLSRKYVTARIPVGANPEAVVVSADGTAAYVANRLDDTISVIDTSADKVVRTLRLGDPASPDRLARGEQLFHSGQRTFQGQFSCSSCHPDRGFDGLQYDLEPDGLGIDVLDNRNLRGVGGTGPFKWVGSNPDIATQCGTRTAKWIVRTGWLTSMQVVELSEYIRSIEPVVNPYRSTDGTLTEAQQRGKALFERTTRNDGEPLRKADQCHFCHSGSKFFNGQKFDVGTKGPHDRYSEFDTAHLTNIFDSAPYLHDGRAATLEEIWTKYNLDDKHGYSSDWTKDQLNDLVEYLKCL